MDYEIYNTVRLAVEELLLQATTALAKNQLQLALDKIEYAGEKVETLILRSAENVGA